MNSDGTAASEASGEPDAADRSEPPSTAQPAKRTAAPGRAGPPVCGGSSDGDLPQPRQPQAADDGAAADVPRPTGRQRLVGALWPPRLTRPQLTAALLLLVLGLGLAVQVRTNSDNGALRGARREDLVGILSELDSRTQRLEDEKHTLENQLAQLRTSSDQAAEARRQQEQKARQLGILAGTVAAQGPGIMLTIRGGNVASDDLLDALEELRAAGAEAIQLDDVRAVPSTYFSDAVGGVRIDGHKVSPPYVFKVIGNPPDLVPALNIPGGVVQMLQKEQATVSVVTSQKIVVDALRSAKQPDYARSSSQ